MYYITLLCINRPLITHETRRLKLPRVIPYMQKEEWFEEFEKGKTVSRLATLYKRDPRTIERGIEEVRQMRQVQKVRVNLLEEAMRKHQESLLDLLSEGAQRAGPLPLHIDEIYTAKSPPTPLGLDGKQAIAIDVRYDQVILAVEESHRWELLRQHLRRDRLYTHLRHWKQTMLAELNIRWGLKLRVQEKLTDELGFTISEDSIVPGTLRPACLFEITKSVFSTTLEETTPHPLRLTEGAAGEFFVNDSTAGRLSNTQGAKLADIRRISEEVSGEPLASDLRSCRKQAVSAAAEAKRAFDEIRLSFYIPGICDSCQRYGL